MPLSGMQSSWLLDLSRNSRTLSNDAVITQALQENDGQKAYERLKELASYRSLSCKDRVHLGLDIPDILTISEFAYVTIKVFDDMRQLD